MSSPKFMVFKLKDLKIPALVLLVVIALFVFFMFRGKNATQTFAPSDTYQDGKYIAGITLSDTEMDLVVEVKDNQIISVSLNGLDDPSTKLYKDLVSGIDYVNTYVTSTQSTELPTSASISAATNLLMDAVKIALSDKTGEPMSYTYETLTLSNQTLSKDTLENSILEDSSLQEDIFVDEFDPALDTEEETAETSSSDTSSSKDITQNSDAANDSNTHTSVLEENIVE